MSENPSTMYFVLHKILHFEKLEDRIIDLEHKNCELEVNLKILEDKFANLTRSENGFEEKDPISTKGTISTCTTKVNQKVQKPDIFIENSLYMGEMGDDIQKSTKFLVTNPDIVITNLNTSSSSETEGVNFENDNENDVKTLGLKNLVIGLSRIDDNIRDNQQNPAETETKTMEVNTGEKSKKYKCKNCSETFKISSKLYQHIRKVHQIKIKPFKCTICLKSYSTLWNLKEHQTRIHNSSVSKFENSLESLEKCITITITDSGEIKTFQCKFCPRNFPQKARLVNHYKLHAKERPFDCSFCSSKFAKSAQLSRHLIKHIGKYPFKCSLCPLKFTKKYALARHSLIHNANRDKPYICHICPAVYGYSQNLKRHIESHKIKEENQANLHLQL